MKVIFFGTPEFAVPSLRALAASRHEIVLAVAQPDRPVGRGMKLTKPPVAAAAIELGVPLLQPEKIRNEEFLDAIRAAGAGIAAVVAYGKILPASLLVIPPHGFINVHGSILPKYRGAAPIQRSIENGDRETGVTIMRIDEQLDHGPMLLVAKTPIGPDEHTPQVAARLAVIGAKALVEVFNAIEEGRASEVEQDHDQATHAAKIQKEEALIDWTQPARATYDRFRAFDPWPGLVTAFRGETLKLPDIRPADRSGAPGKILSVSPLIVACGEGALELVKVQRPAKGAVDGATFARGASLREGESFE